MKLNKIEKEKINDLIGISYAVVALQLDCTNSEQKKILEDLNKSLQSIRDYIKGE